MVEIKGVIFLAMAMLKDYEEYADKIDRETNFDINLYT